MLAKMTSASFSSSNRRVSVNLETSTSVGYTNNCQQYSPYGIMSVPLPGQLVLISQQSAAQVVVSGYNNQVNDENFSILPGETTIYAPSWYIRNAIAGCAIQQANSANVEHQMMGESTNSVIADILEYLVGLQGYIASHVHSGCGGDINSGAPTTSPPATGSLSTDQTYIAANQNLAITGTYQPKVSLEDIFARLRGLE